MEEYKSNSHKSRQNQNDDIPEKRVEKVVSGSVKSKKKNGLQKITNVFVPEDVDDVKSYILRHRGSGRKRYYLGCCQSIPWC